MCAKAVKCRIKGQDIGYKGQTIGRSQSTLDLPTHVIGQLVDGGGQEDVRTLNDPPEVTGVGSC